MTTARRPERPRYDPNDRMANLQRVPPSATDAERAVLGCLMTEYGDDHHALKMARERLVPSDFFYDAHRHVFEAILRLADGEGRLDPLSVADELRRVGQLDFAGGIEALKQYCGEVPTASSLPRYAAAVRRTSGQRRAIERAGEIMGLAYDGVPPEELALQFRAVSSDPQLAPSGGGPRIATVTAAELRARVYDPIRWAVPGLIPEGLTLLTGRSKIGKSFMVHGIAAGVAEGGMVLSSVPVEGGDVLYLALEDPERRLQSRHSQIAPDGSWPGRLHFAIHARTFGDGLLADIGEFVASHPETRLIVIDTFGRARGKADERAGVFWTEYELMARVQQFAISHKIAIVCTHHTNKLQETADEFDPVSGSTGMQAACDALILVKRKRNESLAELIVTGREIKDERLALQWTDGGGWTLLGDAEAYFRSAEELDVLLILSTADAPVTPRELGDELGITAGAAGKRLERMGDRGLVKRTSKGYACTEIGQRSLRAAGLAAMFDETVSPEGDAVHMSEHVGGVGAVNGVGSVGGSCSTPDISDTPDTSDRSDTSDTKTISGLNGEGAGAVWGGAA